jgi:hypothetical protein
LDESGQSKVSRIDNINVSEQEETISAKGSTKRLFSQQIQALGRVGFIKSQSIQARGSIVNSYFANISSRGSIKVTTSQNVSSQGSIVQIFSQQIEAKGRIGIPIGQLIQAKGNIKSTQDKTISSKGRIGGETYQTIETQGRIEKEFQSVISALGHITSEKEKSVQAKARIEVQTTQSIQSKGNLLEPGGTIEREQTIQAKANIGTYSSIDLEKSSSQYLWILDSTSLSITGDITIELWVKLEQLASTAGESMTIVGKYDNLNNKSDYVFYYKTSNDKLEFVYGSNGTQGARNFIETDDAFFEAGDVGEWVHVAVSVDVSAKTADFYKNGVLRTSNLRVDGSSTSINDSDVEFAVGTAKWGGTLGTLTFDGLMDELRVWNTTRTQNQIKFNRYEILNGDESGLVSYWRFQGDLLDSTSNNNDLTPSGSPVFSIDFPFQELQESQQTIVAKSKIIEGSVGVRTKTIQAKGNISKTSPVIVTGLQAHARIDPPQLFVNEINSVTRELSVRLEMQWDEINWSDESDYFLSGRANEKLAGSLGEGIASTLDIEVDNTTERFTPDNSSSPIVDYLKPRVKIRVSIVVAGYAYRMFTGYIKNIHPDSRSRICSLECFDNQVLVYNKRANGIVYEDFRTDQLMAELAELAELQDEQFVLDSGDQDVNFGYFEDRNVWPIMGEIAVAERGRVFFDRYGILTFWNRSRLHNRTPSFNITQEDWIKDLDYSVAEHEIKNAVIVKAAPRYSAGIQVVWSSGNAEFLDPYSDTLVFVPSKTSQLAFLDLEDPCTTFIVPIPNIDYTANSAQDGSGNDLTDDIEITEFINYGNAVFLSVENKSNEGAFLTKFQIRGNPAKVLKFIKVTATDQPSIEAYGRQEFELENHFITSEDAATQIADEELQRRREAINLFRIDIIGIPHLLTGDVISIEHRPSEFKDFLVQEMNWTLDDGGFQQTLTLTNPYTFPTIQRMTARAFIIQGDSVAHVQAKANIT